jgi:hypothetical protein
MTHKRTGAKRTRALERSKLRARLPSHTTVAAYLALFAAFGTGGAYAVNEWTGANIQDGSLTGADVQDLSLGLPDYGANSISTGKLKDQDVRTQDLRDLGVTNPKIAWDSVSSGKVINNNLTGDDINESSLGKVPVAAAAEGLSEVQLGSTSAIANPEGAQTYSEVSCDAGWRAIGGGVQAYGSLADKQEIHSSYPGSFGWRAQVDNQPGDDGNAANDFFNVYLICVRAP